MCEFVSVLYIFYIFFTFSADDFQSKCISSENSGL